MKKIEIELNNIFLEYKEKYMSEFDQSESLNAKLNNQLKFTPLSFKLADELIEKANENLNTISKVETEEIIKKLVLKFSQLFHNPFAKFP